jgi:hypothetical protein
LHLPVTLFFFFFFAVLGIEPSQELYHWATSTDPLTL